MLTVTAASHAEASAFFTPNDDMGSANDAASPTSSARPTANSDEVYIDAVTAQASPTGAAGFVMERMRAVFSISASKAAERSAAPSITAWSSGSSMTAT